MVKGDTVLKFDVSQLADEGEKGRGKRHFVNAFLIHMYISRIFSPLNEILCLPGQFMIADVGLHSTDYGEVHWRPCIVFFFSLAVSALVIKVMISPMYC